MSTRYPSIGIIDESTIPAFGLKRVTEQDGSKTLIHCITFHASLNGRSSEKAMQLTDCKADCTVWEDQIIQSFGERDLKEKAKRSHCAILLSPCVCK